VTEETNSLIAGNYFLQPGYIYVTEKPMIISTVLGSSVSVCLHDRKRKTGGMNHFLLPSIHDRGKTTARYGNVATLALIRMMLNSGSKIKHLDAQVFGGALDPKTSTRDVGRENILLARQILAKQRVKIVSEDVGGQRGRKIVFNTHTNEVALFKPDRLRKGDWYPYEASR
jgi:chemotaxis protein CheD